MLKKLSGLIFSCYALSGCVSVNHVPLTASQSEELRGKTVATSNYETADFTAFTAGKAAFGAIGAATMVSAGNKIIEENNIPDPAIAIKSGLVENMQKARAIKVIDSSGTVSSDDAVNNLIAEYGSVDYILDIKTLNWMFNYYPTDWSHYRVTYQARLRLIDTASKDVIAETMCSSVQGDDENPPTKDDLLENEAALLKDYLEKASQACVDVLSSQILML